MFNLNACKLIYANVNKPTMIPTMYNNDILGPIYNIFMGIINIITSRSSKTAKILAFWKTQVLESPAAFNILNKTPADVGAEKILTSISVFQILYSSPTLGSAYL